MFKKGLAGGLIALALAFAFSLTALAAPATDTGTPPTQPHRRARVAQVTAVDANAFTVTTPNGKTVTVQVDEQTAYRLAGGGAASFADIQVGRWVTGRFERTDQEGVLHARVVVILPEDFDPGQWKDARRYMGKITAVGDSALTLQTRDGQTLPFAVTADTKFRSRDGSVNGLGDLQPGMGAIVIARKQDDGSLLALGIGAGKIRSERPSHYMGKITAVGDSTLTIQTRDGQTFTFAVTANTKFRSRDGSVNGLDDLQPGMGAIIIARKQDDGSLLALGIGAGKIRSERPSRYMGKITAVGDSTLTIQTRDGQTFTFAVTANTKFRSRDGSVNGLDDLQPGMPVLVIARQQEDGSLTALGIGAGKPGGKR